jgi:hypothetical protein
MDNAAANTLGGSLFLCVLLFCLHQCSEGEKQREHELNMREPCKCECECKDETMDHELTNFEIVHNGSRGN